MPVWDMKRDTLKGLGLLLGQRTDIGWRSTGHQQPFNCLAHVAFRRSERVCSSPLSEPHGDELRECACDGNRRACHGQSRLF